MLRSLNYPLSLTFKIVAFAPQFSIRDANGTLVAYVKQKLFKLKEAVTVFGDEAQTQPLYTLAADRILDFSARYRFADTSGRELGSVKRQGLRSLWKAQYDILDGETQVMTIREENAWIKVLDALLNELPIVGLFTGYFLHPAYLVSRSDGTLVMRIEKQPAFFEGKFLVEKKMPLGDVEEQRILLSLIMMVLLERSRG